MQPEWRPVTTTKPSTKRGGKHFLLEAFRQSFQVLYYVLLMFWLFLLIPTLSKDLQFKYLNKLSISQII